MASGARNKSVVAICLTALAMLVWAGMPATAGARVVISGGEAASTLLTTIVAIDPIQFVFDASESDYLKYSRLNASGTRPTSRDTPNPVRIRLLASVMSP